MMIHPLLQPDRYKGEVFDFVPIKGQRQTFLFSLFHSFHVSTPETSNSPRIASRTFGIVTAFCKLVPKTNRHVQNDMQVTAEKRYTMGSYWFIEIIF